MGKWVLFGNGNSANLNHTNALAEAIINLRKGNQVGEPLIRIPYGTPENYEIEIKHLKNKKRR
ncbi:MAG: hypothetical protein ABIH20_04320 [Candidatus Diapherotrites archaeon]